MNRFHENHPDPEVRQKFKDWQVAHDSHRARSHGFDTVGELTKEKKKCKEMEKIRRFFPMAGLRLAPKSSTKKPASSRPLQRSSQRGS